MKLSTHLNIGECKNRIKAAAEPPEFVLGEFRGNAFRLRTRKFYRNSFAPMLYGKFAEKPGGTVLTGEFKMHPLVRLFMVIWFSFLVLFGAALLVVPARVPLYHENERGLLIVALAGLAAFGFLLVLAGKWLARSDKAILHAFLKTTLEAADDSPVAS